jgi:hypothetical protein
MGVDGRALSALCGGDVIKPDTKLTKAELDELWALYRHLRGAVGKLERILPLREPQSQSDDEGTRRTS